MEAAPDSKSSTPTCSPAEDRDLPYPREFFKRPHGVSGAEVSNCTRVWAAISAATGQARPGR